MKYWSKMEKIIDLFNVIVKLEHDYIDINQRLVAIKLFD